MQDKIKISGSSMRHEVTHLSYCRNPKNRSNDPSLLFYFHDTQFFKKLFLGP